MSANTKNNSSAPVNTPLAAAATAATVDVDGDALVSVPLELDEENTSTLSVSLGSLSLPGTLDEELVEAYVIGAGSAETEIAKAKEPSLSETPEEGTRTELLEVAPEETKADETTPDETNPAKAEESSGGSSTSKSSNTESSTPESSSSTSESSTPAWSSREGTFHERASQRRYLNRQGGKAPPQAGPSRPRSPVAYSISHPRPFIRLLPNGEFGDSEYQEFKFGGKRTPHNWNTPQNEAMGFHAQRTRHVRPVYPRWENPAAVRMRPRVTPVYSSSCRSWAGVPRSLPDNVEVFSTPVVRSRMDADILPHPYTSVLQRQQQQQQQQRPLHPQQQRQWEGRTLQAQTGTPHSRSPIVSPSHTPSIFSFPGPPDYRRIAFAPRRPVPGSLRQRFRGRPLFPPGLPVPGFTLPIVPPRGTPSSLIPNLNSQPGPSNSTEGFTTPSEHISGMVNKVLTCDPPSPLRQQESAEDSPTPAPLQQLVPTTMLPLPFPGWSRSNSSSLPPPPPPSRIQSHSHRRPETIIHRVSSSTQVFAHFLEGYSVKDSHFIPAASVTGRAAEYHCGISDTGETKYFIQVSQHAAATRQVETGGTIAYGPLGDPLVLSIPCRGEPRFRYFIEAISPMPSADLYSGAPASRMRLAGMKNAPIVYPGCFSPTRLFFGFSDDGKSSTFMGYNATGNWGAIEKDYTHGSQGRIRG